MRKLFFIAFVCFCGIPLSAQDAIKSAESTVANENPKKQEKSKNSDLFFMDMFYGLSFYREKMPDKIQQTYTLTTGGPIFTNPGSASVSGEYDWDFKGNKGNFFTLGTSISFLFSKVFGAYADVALIAILSGMESEMDLIMGLTEDGDLLGKTALFNDKSIDGIKYENVETSVLGVAFSVGPTFALVNTKIHKLLLIPKFNLQSYTMKVDISNDGFILLGDDGSENVYKASYVMMNKSTEFGLGLLLNYRYLFGKHAYLSPKIGLSLDFWQLKTVSEEVEFGSNNTWKYEIEANSGVKNFSFLATIGIGFRF
ncbi:MAG: hypothetical protein Ta2F_16380 [Termitinemataceae bacterium]|nr:MAG: hypothetical protein Ta2F_16380 [Termitinemataceae bacterium]